MIPELSIMDWIETIKSIMGWIEPIKLVKDYWDEAALIWYAILNCIEAVKKLVHYKRYVAVVYDPTLGENVGKPVTLAGAITGMLRNTAIFVPVLLLLISKMVFSKTWLVLTGYVMGAVIYDVVSSLHVLFMSKEEAQNRNLSTVVAKGISAVGVCLGIIFG